MTPVDAPVIAPLHPPRRILLGPGPSPVDERVLRAMSAPLLGHLDPLFVRTMDDVQALLRYVFETNNRLTFPVSGTGSAGMEAALVNLLEPGEEVVMCVNGYFGERMCEIATRIGAQPLRVACEWGGPVDIDKARQVWRHSKARVLCAVHAETSTGVLQPLAPLRDIVDERDGFLLIDAVTSIGAHALSVDRHRVDVCYAGSQKALSCPPGLAPITFSARAVDKITTRQTPVRSWYFDTTMLMEYWGETSGGGRAYDHTAPIAMNYALHEALRMVAEEGLAARAQRHERHHRALVAGVEVLGLQMQVVPEYRLWTLNTVRIPAGVDYARVRSRLLHEFDIEIGGGLGVFRGKVWRIGLMGASSTANNVLLLLAALEKVLKAEGVKIKESGVSAAVAEVGHGWLPHWVIRLGQMTQYVSGTTPKLQYTPLEYVQQGRFRCAAEPFEGPEMTKACIDILGTGALMHQSDYPHGEAYFPDTASMVLNWPIWSALGEQALRQHMYDNAATFLRLL